MVTPVRLMMAHTGFVDTSSWTEVHVGRTSRVPSSYPSYPWRISRGDTVSFYRAVVAEGRDAVGVDWGDGTGMEYVRPGADRSVSLSHTYAKAADGYVIRITDDLSEFYVSHAAFKDDWYNGSRQSAMVPSWEEPYSGAECVSDVASLGSRVSNRTYSIGLFANTRIHSMPTVYGFPSLTPLADAKCVPAMCFLRCPSLRVVRSLADVKAIDASAFEECTTLENLSDFDARSVLHIGPRAFRGCTSIRQLSGLGSATLGVNQDAALFGKQLPSFTESDIAAASEALGVASSPKFARFRINYFNCPLGAQAFYGCTYLNDLSLGPSMGAGGFALPDTFSGTSLSSVPTSRRGWFYCQTYSNLNFPDAWEFGSPATRVLNSSDYYSCSYSGYQRSTSSLFADVVWAFFRGCSKMASEPPGPHSQSGAQLVSTGEFEGMSALTATITLPSSIQRIGASAFSGSGVTLLVLQGKTKAQAQAMEGVRGLCFGGYDVTTYPFGLKSGAVVRCTDGDLTV